MKRGYQWAASILGGLALMAGLGALYQNRAERKDRAKFPPPGRLIDVGDARLHLTCRGAGSPTVILEAGLSCTHLDWSRVIPEVAKITRVVAYDRGGYGWSSSGRRPRTGLRMANELHTLLEKAGIAGPYLLVGHSYGAHLVRLFASQYPGEVVGIVLVDGSPEDQRKVFEQSMTFRERMEDEAGWQIYRLRPVLARLGILRLRKEPNGYIHALPEEVQPAATAVGLFTRAYDWIFSEAPSIDATCAEVRKAVLPQHIRSTVLTAGGSIPMPDKQAIWIRLQQGLAARLPNCTSAIVEGSGHFMHLEKPEVVIQAVCQMVEEIQRASAKP